MGVDKKKIINGTLWSILEVIIKRGWDLFIRIILARLLLPEDFGVIGMATVFTSLIQVLNDAGIGVALIQRKEERLSQELLSTTFWSGIVWSVVLYLTMCFIVTPFASAFYDEPLLLNVLPVLSIPILTSAIKTVTQPLLTRDLNFKKIAFINNSTTIIGGIIALFLAFSGYGVWALVANSITSLILAAPAYAYVTRWRPSFVWHKKEFASIFKFGVFVTATNLIISISSNIDYLIIGKFINKETLGAYSLAFMLTHLVKNQITSVINRVMFPFYSSIQGDFERVKSYYLKLVNFYFLITSFIMLNLFFFTEEIILTVFGTKWVLAILPIKYLSIAVLFGVLTAGYNLLFRSIGKSKTEFLVVFSTLLFIYIPFMFFGVIYAGIEGLCISILLSQAFIFFTIQTILKLKLNITYTDLFKTIRKALFVVIVSSLIPLLVANLRGHTLTSIIGFNLVFVFTTYHLFRNEFLKILK